MATAYNPSIVRDGLVLCLDAANPKSLLTSVEVLVVAGGGGGGHGGGGAGGLIYNSAFSVNPGTALTVTVGAGGTGGIAGSRGATPAGANGGNSVFGSLTSIGGGGGSAAGNASAGNGGSGGGQGGDQPSATRTLGTAGQGFGGGRSSRASYGAAGGGGGAGGSGSDATDQSGTIGQGGNGGVGLQYSISGSNVFYAGGGGGGANLNTPDTTASGGGVGGTGGGGSGGLITDSGFRAATTPNTGGGGGGAEYEGALAGGGAGGSGVVIVRYFGPARATGGTITSVGGYTIHSFTTVGSTTFTPNATWSDLSGNGITGTLTNGTTYSSANGGSIVFDGTTTQLHPTINHSYLSSSALEVIFKSTSHGSGYKTIFGYRHNEGYSRPTIGSLYLDNNTLSASVITASQVYRTATVADNININTYYHVVLNKNTTTGVLDIYVNGVLSGTQTFDAATYGQWSSAGSYIGSNLLDIGKSTNTNSAQGWSTDFFNGVIPVAKVYNRVLSAAEILQNFNALRGRYGV